jgi:ribosomal protein S12 methylthiotransferase
MTMGWLDEMKKLKKFIPYFDLPLQHVSPDLLKRMKRFSDIDKIRQFLTHIRENFPESYIRTNIIV